MQPDERSARTAHNLENKPLEFSEMAAVAYKSTQAFLGQIFKDVKALAEEPSWEQGAPSPTLSNEEMHVRVEELKKYDDADTSAIEEEEAFQMALALSLSDEEERKRTQDLEKNAKNLSINDVDPDLINLNLETGEKSQKDLSGTNEEANT